MRLGLTAVVVLLATGCASSHHAVPPQIPQRPSLPTKASSDSPQCPRHPKTTVDYEACAGLRAFKLDARFDRAVTALWPLLDAIGRQEFADGQRAWNHYVAQDCHVEAREYLGGTEAPLATAYCEVALTRARVKEVAGTLASYRQGK